MWWNKRGFDGLAFKYLLQFKYKLHRNLFMKYTFLVISILVRLLVVRVYQLFECGTIKGNHNRQIPYMNEMNDCGKYVYVGHWTMGILNINLYLHSWCLWIAAFCTFHLFIIIYFRCSEWAMRALSDICTHSSNKVDEPSVGRWWEQIWDVLRKLLTCVTLLYVILV